MALGNPWERVVWPPQWGVYPQAENHCTRVWKKKRHLPPSASISHSNAWHLASYSLINIVSKHSYVWSHSQLHEQCPSQQEVWKCKVCSPELPGIWTKLFVCFLNIKELWFYFGLLFLASHFILFYLILRKSFRLSLGSPKTDPPISAS